MRTFPALFLFGALAAASAAAADQGLEAAIGGAVGGGLGALIGNELGGREGAVAGGALGAAAGAAVATDAGFSEPPVYGSYQEEVYYQESPPGPPGFCPPGLAKQGRCR
jgi:hypothetical protein